jgi:uncharacterized phage protein gp47/JayE
MAIPTIPTIAAIRTRIISDIEGKIGDTVPLLPKAFVFVLAASLAGLFFLLYQAIMWVYRQIFAQSAEWGSLLFMGTILGLTPTTEVACVIACTVTGSGANVPKGTVFFAANGIGYKVTTTTTIIDGTAADVPLRALTAGAIGTLIAGDELNISKTTLGLDGTATVTSVTTDGSDSEAKENFRARVIARFRHRATGGSVYDYNMWGMEMPNAIWCGPYNDETMANKIHVYLAVDNQTDNIPTSAQLLTLEDYLTLDPDTGYANRAPMNDLLECHAITRHEFDVDITVQDCDTDTQDAIEAAVTDYIAAFRPYIEGVTDARDDTMTVSNVSNVAQDTAALDGGTVVSVTITDVVTAAEIPGDRYTFQSGEFGKVRNVDFDEVS